MTVQNTLGNHSTFLPLLIKCPLSNACQWSLQTTNDCGLALTGFSASRKGCSTPYLAMPSLIYFRTPILFSNPLIFSPRSVPRWHSAASGSLVHFAVYLVPSHFLNSIPTSTISFFYPLSIWSCTPRKSSHFPILNTIFPRKPHPFRPKDGSSSVAACVY